jgi:hypothetical protein
VKNAAFLEVYAVAVIVLVVYFVAAWSGIVGLPGADGPYKGKIVDAETGEPIAGAAVLAVWRKQAPGIGHPREGIFDAKEAVTDENGDFFIPGTSGLAVGWRIQEPIFAIFKPGYEALVGSWRDEWAEARLLRLKTRDERLRNLSTIFIVSGQVPERKYPHLKKLKAEERMSLGSISDTINVTRINSQAADFLAIWERLKRALKAGNTQAALNEIAIRSRDRYAEIFRELGAVPDIESELPQIVPVVIRAEEAEFESVRRGQSFAVLFERDQDGVWRISSF